MNEEVEGYHEKVAVCVVLAKGAVKAPAVYFGIDPESQMRIDDATAWAKIHCSEGQMWIFGAGAQYHYRHGKTLGNLMENFFRQKNSDLASFSNKLDPHFYGTLEEIHWAVKKVGETVPPGGRKFVFFTQRRHMRRVRLIWRLFYKEEWGEAEFVVVPHVAEIPWRHEFFATIKVGLIYLGWKKPRYVYPYLE